MAAGLRLSSTRKVPVSSAVGADRSQKKPPSQIGWDLANGKAIVPGVRNSKISWTTREDTARFLIYTLAHFASSELSRKTFNIEGDSLVGSYFVAVEIADGTYFSDTRRGR